tara:strand:+ start:767 stop:2305 length:1539 start_codon:yes stop_codon:yes gene_type:complete
MVGFNDRSTERMAGVDPRLLEILNRARTLSGVNFEISEGMRNANRQAELVASGASQTQNSRHLTGNATDIFIPDGRGGVNWDFEAYRPIADAAKLAAKELGYNDFQWGGDWESLRDGVHFQVGRSGSTPATQSRTSTRGSQPMAQPMTPTQQAPQGILEMMGIQKRDPSAQDQTALPFYQRDQFKNTMGNIAMAANTLRQRPDENIAKQVQANRQQRDLTQRSSKTAQWLSQQPGGQPFVEMLNAGADPAAVLQAYQKAVSTKPDQTAAMQNYAEYQRILAADGPEAAEKFRAMSQSGTTVNTGDIGTGNYLYGSKYGLESGERLNIETGTVEIIPGSKAETDANTAAADAASRAAILASRTDEQGSVVDKKVDQLVGMLETGGFFNLPEAGIGGNLLAKAGVNQEAVTFKNEILAIQSIIAFDQLAKMRAASKTGAALGSVTVAELDLLMSAYGSLQQSTDPKVLAANLKDIKRVMGLIENDPIARQVYYGGAATAAPSQSSDISVGDPFS